MAVTPDTDSDAEPNAHYEDDELNELTETMLILSSTRRIRTLVALLDETEIRRTELVSKVVQSTYSERITAQKRKRILISLYQQHLPKLDKLDVLSWNRETDIVRSGERYEDVMTTFWWAMAVCRT